MKTIKAYITKDFQGTVELWKSEPKYKREFGMWAASDPTEVGSDLTDDFLDEMVNKGECIEIKITKIKTTYNYANTPEGHLMNAIFDNAKKK